MNTEAERLERQQEIIADIAFNGGMYWQRLGSETANQVSEAIEGSRGLMQKFVQWAGEFDAFWEGLDDNDDRRQNYITEIDDFAIGKINAMIAEIRLS